MATAGRGNWPLPSGLLWDCAQLRRVLTFADRDTTEQTVFAEFFFEPSQGGAAEALPAGQAVSVAQGSASGTGRASWGVSGQDALAAVGVAGGAGRAAGAPLGEAAALSVGGVVGSGMAALVVAGVAVSGDAGQPDAAGAAAATPGGCAGVVGAGVSVAEARSDCPIVGHEMLSAVGETLASGNAASEPSGDTSSDALGTSGWRIVQGFGAAMGEAAEEIAAARRAGAATPRPVPSMRAAVGIATATGGAGARPSGACVVALASDAVVVSGIHGPSDEELAVLLLAA